MRRSEAARYARWSATIAILLACVTLGAYLRRDWQRILERRKAPPPAPLNVEKQSSGLTLSKMEGPRTIFTIAASKSTDFRDLKDSVLENVKVTIYGESGQRHDVMQSRTCQYAKTGDTVTCSGEVDMDLESAADAALAGSHQDAAPQVVHVQTSALVFDRSSGVARTAQPVTFRFPNGRGKAVGASYDSNAGTLQLLRAVTLELTPPAAKESTKAKRLGAAPAGPAGNVRVTGASLEFGRDARILHILGPAQAQSATATLNAGEFTLELDSSFQPHRLLAVAGGAHETPELTSRRGSGTLTLAADQLTGLFAPEGWMSRLDGAGSVRGTRQGDNEQDDFHSGTASLDLWPRDNQAKELNLGGGVYMKTNVKKSGDTRILQTGALRVDFVESPGGQPSRPSRAETLTAGSIEWTDASTKPGAAPTATKLEADKLSLIFGPEGKTRQVDASSDVRIERKLPGHAVQTARAKGGVAQLLASGGWSQMELSGNVNLKEADRTAQAEYATFLRAGQMAILTGHAVARDASTETRAPRIQFNGSNGDIRAQGDVVSTDFSPNRSAVHFAQVPVNISSDTMQGNTNENRAVYSGHARLWQGESVLEADSIEVLRGQQVLNATGNVRAVFPKATQTAAIPAARSVSDKPAAVWHISCGALRYSEAAEKAQLEKNVIVQSSDERIRAPQMDLYFTGTRGNSTSISGEAPSSPGAKQISRAIGTGGVIVDQGDRRATAERGEYTATDGKFVMSGGKPTLFDGSAGTTTGRQLTFFLADDTIIVDSENGSRTLTKHRVEK
ncbi:MAG TPA: LPS export ABC transporter periplasmic protein LptC [Candidatus Acidoferrum sp.]|nr:LPS export ABC transporter periplasmic protein LptC [Candidatus Acidoferrum sp.]